MNIIIPLCGIGKRFTDAGFNKPKPLIKISDKIMIRHVLDNLKYDDNDKIFIIYHTSLNDYDFSNIIKTYYNNVILIPIYERTKGAAETVLYGVKYIKCNNLTDHKNYLIIDCDTVYYSDIIKKLKKINNNAVIYFNDTNNKPLYSYICLDINNNIINIKEKEQISKNANTGAYYFINDNELIEACEYIIKNNIKFKNEYYISCVIKHMIDNEKIFKGITIDNEKFTSLGTPDDIIKYNERIHAFLFDLDGTIVITDDIYINVWKNIMSQFNIEITPNIFNEFIQGNSDEFAMKQLRIKENQYDLNNISQLKDKYFKENIDKIIIIEGIEPFMKSLKKLGHRICIVSNSNRNICELILKNINLYKYIDYIIIGNECNRPKPYPDPYEKAIELLNITSDKCIIFEDSKPGILSALNVSPKCIVGLNSYNNNHILSELKINNIIKNYNNININDFLNNLDIDKRINNIKTYINNSLKNMYSIKDIIIDNNKLKGGYISDVIKVEIILENNTRLDCIFKYENDYTSSLTKMAYKLGLFDREYYFYESISNYVNINIPKFYGIVRNENYITKGIILENINKENFKLGLDLNKENIDVSLKVIEECARLHSLFWNKDLDRTFKYLKRHNDNLFNPIWGNFIKDKWSQFISKWHNIIDTNTIKKMEDIVDNFNKIQESLSINNLTLCHGDVKSGNIFYKKNGNNYDPYFIDWQYIVYGKGIQDIVFFIIESFKLENIELYLDLFKNYYYIKLKEFGITNYSLEEYNNDFKNAICYFPFFVAIWFGTTPADELIDVSFPLIFIQKLTYCISKYI